LRNAIEITAVDASGGEVRKSMGKRAGGKFSCHLSFSRKKFAKIPKWISRAFAVAQHRFRHLTALTSAIRLFHHASA
jgi:hypothetical protein